MKKLSLMLLLVFAGSVMIYTSAVSQEKMIDTEEAKEVITKEDAAVTPTDKVYEQENVTALKGQPKTFNDGYNTYVNSKVGFVLSDVDNIMKDSIFYMIDGKEETKYTGPFTISEEGTHVITYYSVDKMGNRETQKSITVIVDVTAPVVTVSITAPFAKNNDVIYVSDKFSYNYAISAKDNLSGVASVTYAIPGEDQKEYIKPFVAVSATPIKLQVSSVDKVGNATDKYATKVFDESGALLAESIDDLKIVVDKTAPEVQIKSDKEFFLKDNMNVASKDYKYAISATDAESGVKSLYYRIDNNGEFLLYTGEIQFMTNGLHKIEAIAKDGVGNVSKTAVLDVFVDIIPADTKIQFVTE